MLKRVSVESILVMFLFIMFTASIGLLIVEGQEAFGQIIESKNSNEATRIGLSYINMKVKQNNLANHVTVVSTEYNSHKALLINHYGAEEAYVTYILYDEGALYECYMNKGEPLDITLGEVIVEMDAPVSFEYDKALDMINVLQNEQVALSMQVFRTEDAYE